MNHEHKEGAIFVLATIFGFLAGIGFTLFLLK